MYSLILRGLTVCFVRKATITFNTFPPGLSHFIFYKDDVCIEPSIMKARYYLVLLQVFFLQELANQVSDLNIIQIGEREVGITFDP